MDRRGHGYRGWIEGGMATGEGIGGDGDRGDRRGMGHGYRGWIGGGMATGDGHGDRGWIGGSMVTGDG